MKNNVLLITLITIFFFSCKETPKKKVTAPLLLTTYTKKKKPRKIKAKEKKIYKRQLEIVTGSRDFSYFDKDTRDSIVLRIPVANDNFKFYNIYNITNGNNKGILVIISDNSKNEVCEISEKTHILDTLVFAHKLKHYRTNLSLTLKMKDSLQTFVFNDYLPNFLKDSLKYINRHHAVLERVGDWTWSCENSFFQEYFNIDDKQPKESGGGVIVSFP